MECCFQIAYGRDHLSEETWKTLLLGQMHEGQKTNIIKTPSTSSVQTYKELYMAAKSEEKRMTSAIFTS